MRAVLDYCTGATRREVPTGTFVLHEGSKTGHLFVLMAGTTQRNRIFVGLLMYSMMERRLPSLPDRERSRPRTRSCGPQRNLVHQL